MRFEYAPDESYQDVGGGQVLHSAPGFPGFPARLALELFERARVLAGTGRVGLWDPMCGAGGIVATLALLRRDALTRVLASDVSDRALELAVKNLRLTTPEGLAQRRGQLRAQSAVTGRLESVDRLLEKVRRGPPVPADLARADATDPADVARLDLAGIGVVIADLPYGTQADWSSEAPTPAARTLRTLAGALGAGAVIVLSTVNREDLRGCPPALRSFKHGRRHLRMYRVEEPTAR
ncbi:rRNA methyltransferase [Occultella glacieicola]|uniref:rRNA methyltransferase n=1 Tax=Occultella glacieicola TaxID=2518684 RepID=UPI0014042B6B|nr:rRNA methyltransferase [Occultella glacieicola]